MRTSAIVGLCLVLACGDDDSTPDAGNDAAVDAFAPDATDAGDLPDAATDAGPVVEVPLRDPATPPDDLLATSDVESCEVYQAETCEAGRQLRCDVYDTSSEDFAAPTEVFERALLFDRWYDLYHQPVGQTAERIFNRAIASGTPESEWGTPETFEGYRGMWDAAIWNGSALLAATLRYKETGSDADYTRMERKVRDLLLQFDVTGIPGYLARHHYMNMPPGTPNDPRYMLRFDEERRDTRYRPMDPEGVIDLPAHYTEGVEIGGEVYEGEPMWMGNPSIDQYTGPRLGFSQAFDLLRDSSLKERIAEHMSCYLKRLKRIEVRNLQSNPEVLEQLVSLLTESTTLVTEPGDIDLTETDTVVMYVHPNINDNNQDSYDRTCPDTIETEASRVLDATSSDFLLQLVTFGSDIQSRASGPNAIDHFYIVNVRGADAIHMMHLAAMAYYFTGEEQYLRFLQEDLIRDLQTLRVAQTAAAFFTNRYCREFYGHHIAFSPTWAFLQLLDDSDVRDEILRVVEEEMWLKEMSNQDNAKFNLIYAGEVPAEMASGHDRALAQALNNIRSGGRGALVNEPRRTYSIDPADAIARLGDNVPVCPTQEEVDSCEADLSLAGIVIEGRDITFECTGDPRECVTESGECTWAMTALPIPINERRYEDFAWQRNPYIVSGNHDVDGGLQSPGLDITEEFWLARHYGFIDDGEGQVLAWRDVGGCE